MHGKAENKCFFPSAISNVKLGKCRSICAHEHALHVADGYAEMALARKAPMSSAIEHGGTGGEGGGGGVSPQLTSIHSS